MEFYYPETISIETFRGCNARCIMCPIESWSPPYGTMKDEVFTSIVEQLQEFNEKLKSVALFGNGEPLLDKRLEKRISQCKDAEIPNVGFTTNGSLLTERRVRDIIDAYPDWIVISFDSLEKEVYESIKVRLEFDVVLQGILNLIRERDQKKSNTRLVLRFIEQEKNQGQFESYFSFWAPKLNSHLDELHCNQKHNWALGSKGFYGKTACGFVFSRYVILRDGTNPLCCTDFNAEYNFGNVMEKPLLEIVNSPQRREIRRIHDEGKRNLLKLCGTCNIPELNKAGEISLKLLPTGEVLSTDALTPFDNTQARASVKRFWFNTIVP